VTAIILPRKLYAQPRRRVEIHPEWRDQMNFAWMPGSPGTELAHLSVENYSAGATVAESPVGLVYQHSGRILLTSNWRRLDGSAGREITFLCIANPRNTRAAMYCQRNGLNLNQIELRAGCDGFGEQLSNSVGWRASTSAASSTFKLASVVLSSTQWHSFVGLLDRDGNESIFVNGGLGGSGYRGNNEATPQTAAIGGLPDSTAVPYQDGMALMVGWQRALSAAQIADLHLNPWQIFKADPVRIYSLPSVAPGVPTSLLNQNLAATSFRAAWTAPA
jgi:hypothetical protein